MKQQSIVPSEIIEKRIFIIRGQKVILDFHIAELYEVETKALKRAVKRNMDRFPNDFCFELTFDEFQHLRYQLGTSSWGGTRYRPFAFTEQGIAMLSSVLQSKRAIHVNIEIMRAFVKLREVLASHKDLARKLEELEKKYDSQFKIVFDAIRQLLAPPEKPKREIGFRVKEPVARYKAKKNLKD
ncbi:MAG: ORF6N domain-containing protein [Bacteroidota bacterium]|jgi:phage regulator Rha-like protein